MTQSSWFAALIAALLLASPVALASEHEDEAEAERENEEEQAENEAETGDAASEWEVSLDVSAAEASVEMRSERGERESAVYFDYYRDEAAVEFAYEAEAGATESEARMKVQFHQLLEYEDANGNGKYDDGETVVSAWNLNEDDEEFLAGNASEASWSPITRSAHTSDNGVSGHKFTSTATLGSGSLRLDFYVYGDKARLAAATVEPTEIKLDIIIDAYPFESDTSALALLLESEAEAEVETDADTDADEDGVVASASTNGDAARLLFAWKDFASVDGNKKDVHVTRLESTESSSAEEYEHEQLLVLSYPRGDNIVHDPVMGVQTAGEATEKKTPGVAPVLAVGAIAAIALAARRARQRD